MILVTAHCEGVDGWGECVAGEDPFYSSEWTESAWPTIIGYLAPAVLGRNFESGRECAAALGRVRGHRMAKAAMENAVWEAEARQKKLPLWKLLGGSRTEIASGVSIGIQDSVEQLLEKIETELAAGYKRVVTPHIAKESMYLTSGHLPSPSLAMSGSWTSTGLFATTR